MVGMKTTRYIAKCRCGAHTSTLATNVGRADADMGALFYDAKGESGVYGALAMRCASTSSASVGVTPAPTARRAAEGV